MRDTIEEVTVIIPSYNPDEKLQAVVSGLKAAGFYDIIVIDDGSDEEHQKPFELVKDCTVIHHETNRGKGSALKTAFLYCLENRQNKTGVITVDGDNQHRPEDVYACAQKLLEEPNKLVLGCRDFKQPDVPFRSRFGNLMTRAIFSGLCGVKVSDTQTGLRAISMQYLPLLLQIEGERYEYETHMLLDLKNAGIPFVEVPIETVYMENNQASHFHPVRDSIKIYKVILKFVMNSMLSTVIDLVLFYLSFSLLKNVAPLAEIAVIPATVIARICSSFCNYMISRKVVFKSRGSHSLVKYYVLCIAQMSLSALLVNGCTMLVGRGSLMTTIMKAIIDTTLFFLSFRIQRNWVFKKASTECFPIT